MIPHTFRTIELRLGQLISRAFATHAPPGPELLQESSQTKTTQGPTDKFTKRETQLLSHGVDDRETEGAMPGTFLLQHNLLTGRNRQTDSESVEQEPPESSSSYGVNLLMEMIRNCDGPVVSRSQNADTDLLRPGTHDFVMHGPAFTDYESDKIKIARWKEIDPSTALQRLTGTKFEGHYSRVVVDIGSGTCFYGEPSTNEFGTFYPLQITRDGLCIETSHRETITPIGSHHDVMGEGVTRAILEKSGMKETEYFGPKKQQLNLLNVPYATFAQMGGDFFAQLNTPFLLEAIARRDPIPVLTPISMQATHRLNKKIKGNSLELTGFARELVLITKHHYVYHKESGRFINGDEITRLLRQGGRLEKVPLMTDKAYLYHAKTNRFYKDDEAEALILQGEILTRPSEYYWKISMPGKALVPYKKRRDALTIPALVPGPVLE